MKRATHTTIKEDRRFAKEICSGYVPDQPTPQEIMESEWGWKWYREWTEYIQRSCEIEMFSYDM